MTREKVMALKEVREMRRKVDMMMARVRELGEINTGLQLRILGLQKRMERLVVVHRAEMARKDRDMVLANNNMVLMTDNIRAVIQEEGAALQEHE